VYSYLRNAILCGEFKAGDRLVERALAEQLNISRTPIREALFRLESQKFVTTTPRRGVVVNNINRDEIIEIFTILASLESVAARMAAEKIDPSTRAMISAEIDDLLASRDDLKAQGQKIATEENNLRYNDIIGIAAKNARLHEMLYELKDYVRAFTRLTSIQPGRAQEALEEHIQILHAIKDGQPELAENFARIHIQKSKQAYLAAVQQAQHHEIL
jgi:DNA-binding GntR family transcriptional regulator